MIQLQQCTMEAREDPRSALRGSEEQLFKLVSKKQHQHKDGMAPSAVEHALVEGNNDLGWSQLNAGANGCSS